MVLERRVPMMQATQTANTTLRGSETLALNIKAIPTAARSLWEHLVGFSDTPDHRWGISCSIAPTVRRLRGHGHHQGVDAPVIITLAVPRNVVLIVPRQVLSSSVHLPKPVVGEVRCLPKACSVRILLTLDHRESGRLCKLNSNAAEPDRRLLHRQAVAWHQASFRQCDRECRPLQAAR